MLVSDNLKLIFVHIPKTGGLAIRAALSAASDDFRPAGRWHAPPATAKTLPWREYRSFAFVRNPWDRMVSAYAYAVPDRDIGFDEFLTSPRMPEAFMPQVAFLRDADGSRLVTDVGRYETLERDFAAFCPSAPSLKKLNASVHGPYQDHYTDATRDRVAAMFAEDIAAFGYEF